ncbi:hypothetical protein IWW45_004412 [Coemansia sp. RSA 485]|nr:hypothetical protein IWW45_004412 [Coemansia sp. RSA 485]
MLAGHLQADSRGNISVVVDPENINLPEYKESNSDVHFDELEADGFSWRSWPKGINTAGPMTRANKEGVIKLANVHAIRLKQNSGFIIYISMVHYVVDGPAHADIVQRWCLNYQWMANQTTGNPEPLAPFSTDRNLLKQSLSEVRTLVHKKTEKTFTKFSLLAEILARISPELRGYIISKVVERQKAETHIFHISRASLELLQKSVSAHIPDNSTPTINELVLSLATKTMAQAQKMVKKSRSCAWISLFKGIINKKRILPVAVIFEARKQMGLTDKLYAGNVLIPKIVCSDLDQLESMTTEESLAELVAEFGQATCELTPSYIASHINMVDPLPTSFARPLARFIGHKSAMSFVYDVMPDMYKADFGHGRPAWVSPIKPFRANAVLLLTHKDATDGLDVFMSVYPEVMQEVFKNKFWTDIAKLIY